MRQRSWLRRGLVNDMTEINNWMPSTFADQAFQRADAIAIPGRAHHPRLQERNLALPHQRRRDVKLLADFYYHTRARAEETCNSSGGNSRQRGNFRQRGSFRQRSNFRQRGNSRQRTAAGWPAGGGVESGSSRTATRSLIWAKSWRDGASTVKNLAALIYASLPGFCLRQRQMTPASYFQCGPGAGSVDLRRPSLRGIRPPLRRPLRRALTPPLRDENVHGRVPRRCSFLRGSLDSPIA